MLQENLRVLALAELERRGLSVPESICERFDSLGHDDPHRIYRLGIMGGTFDPIHIGHLACAEQARVAFDLDAVVFIPTGNPVFKQDKKVSDASHRVNMCALATADNAHFGVSTLETDREGNTYTVDTLLQLRAFYPENVKLYFITGADAVLHIMKWRDSEIISQMAYLIAVTRPGSNLTAEFKEQMHQYTNFETLYLQMTALSISSSLLRELVMKGESIRYLVDPEVYRYIKEQGLYLPEA